MDIYQPSDDSYLMQNTLKKFLKKKQKTIAILDMGSGSGIQALTCRRLGFKNIKSADINLEAVKLLREKKLEVIYSDLFSGIKKQKFDLIVFNPPYLPEDRLEPNASKIATTAGKKGYEIIVRFLSEAKPYLKPTSTILLLFSSLSKPPIIKKKALELGYIYKLLERKRLFFEELFVYEFKLN